MVIYVKKYKECIMWYIIKDLKTFLMNNMKKYFCEVWSKKNRWKKIEENELWIIGELEKISERNIKINWKD